MTDSTPVPTPDSAGRHRGRRRVVPLAWASAVAAATLLVLGVSGTLSDWTVAILHNNTNTVATAQAVVLKETAGATSCISTSGAGSSNEYTCTTINKYGGTGVGTTPLSPGQSRSTTVTMANVGTGAGALTLKADACSSSGGITTGATDLCGELQITVTCASTAVYPATGTATLTAFGTAASASTVGPLAKDATVDCTFKVTLPADASPTYAGQTASQQLNWTLTAS